MSENAGPAKLVVRQRRRPRGMRPRFGWWITTDNYNVTVDASHLDEDRRRRSFASKAEAEAAGETRLRELQESERFR